MIRFYIREFDIVQFLLAIKILKKSEKKDEKSYEKGIGTPSLFFKPYLLATFLSGSVLAG